MCVDPRAAAAYHGSLKALKAPKKKSEDKMAGSKHQARRTFLSRLGAGAVAAAGVAGTGTIAQAQSPSPVGRPWQPARHAQDDWMDQLSGVHRFVFDTTSPAGFDSALLYVNNYFNANRSGYGLNDADLAVVIVARHDSTPFAYNESMWAKYGKSLVQRSGFVDPNTHQPPTVNIHRAALEGLLQRGVHLAVCQMATRFLAGTIAKAGGANVDTVYAELTANLMTNTHMVPAGIVAVNRAQERGYAFAHAV
jgi:intracellular sulfur oxidation DsrE/DsrF family protein